MVASRYVPPKECFGYARTNKELGFVSKRVVQGHSSYSHNSGSENGGAPRYRSFGHHPQGIPCEKNGWGGAGWRWEVGLL